MSRIKLVFSIIVIIITILLIIRSMKFEQKIVPAEPVIPEFQVTGVSENSKLYQDLSLQTPLTESDSSFRNDLRIKTDPQTAFELIYKKAILNILPGSFIHYDPVSGDLSFIYGELYWNRSSGDPVSVLMDEESSPLTLSEQGRMLKDQDGNMTIWSYKGDCVLKKDTDFLEISPGRSLKIDKKNIRVFSEFPPATPFISPKKKDVYIKKVTDLLIKIDWKSVPGVSAFKVKLYTSKFRENLLMEKTVLTNRTGIDLAEFEHIREFFWEVLPIGDKNIEGEPSPMGKIGIFGLLISEERDRRPPELAITSMTVNGNMVLIRGNTDISSELYIDEEPVKIDSNGVFIFTKKYKDLGLKKIILRVVSPSGVESVQTKQVTIFEE